MERISDENHRNTYLIYMPTRLENNNQSIKTTRDKKPLRCFKLITVCRSSVL